MNTFKQKRQLIQAIVKPEGVRDAREWLSVMRSVIYEWIEEAVTKKFGPPAKPGEKKSPEQFWRECSRATVQLAVTCDEWILETPGYSDLIERAEKELE